MCYSFFLNFYNRFYNFSKTFARGRRSTTPKSQRVPAAYQNKNKYIIRQNLTFGWLKWAHCDDDQQERHDRRSCRVHPSGVCRKPRAPRLFIFFTTFFLLFRFSFLLLVLIRYPLPGVLSLRVVRSTLVSFQSQTTSRTWDLLQLPAVPLTSSQRDERINRALRRGPRKIHKTNKKSGDGSRGARFFIYFFPPVLPGPCRRFFLKQYDNTQIRLHVSANNVLRVQCVSATYSRGKCVVYIVVQGDKKKRKKNQFIEYT